MHRTTRKCNPQIVPFRNNRYYNRIHDLTIPRSCFWFRERRTKKEKLMQKLTVTICALATMITAAYGGTTTYSGKEMKQVEQVPPCPEWYRDTEGNVSLWGTDAFTANKWQDDRYFDSDHAW